MPIVQFDGPEMSEEAKAELAEKLTNSVSEVLKETPRPAIVVIIREDSDENVAVGGELLSRKKRSN